MRAIPIDRFLDPEQGPAPGGDLDWHRLVAEGRAARAAADGGAWRIGRLALLVERRYASGALKRFAEEIGESLGTVRRARWVAGVYAPDACARFPGLSFSHFQAVAALTDRLTWLERARRGGWSVDRLVTESHARAEPTRSAERLRRPVESATRGIARLVERAGDRELAAAARAGLGEAIEELADQVDRLRMRLREASRGRVKLVAHANGHRKAAARAR